jgi:hypothetical protein
MQEPLYVCRNRKASAFDAVEEFARECHDSRPLGEWKAPLFQFRDGVKWYRVTLLKDGWSISEEPTHVD